MKRFSLLVALVALAISASSAQAVNLNPGDTNIAFPAGSLPAGAVIAGTNVTAGPTTVVGNVNGVLQSEVYRETATGTLDFIYQLQNTGADAIHRITAQSFSGFTTNVFSLSSLSGFTNSNVTPITVVDRSTAVQDNGSVIGFNFSAINNVYLPVNSYSSILVIQTNAKNYTTGSTFAIDGGIAAFSTFCPTPEPASLTLLAGCFSLLGFGAARKRLTAKA